jgi:hypothetical protein
MNTKLAAFLIAAIALLIIIKTIQTFRKDKLSTRLLFLWIFIWFSIGFIALYPSIPDKLMKLINLESRPFFIIMVAILILYIIIFYITSAISRINRKISRVIQELSILTYTIKEKDADAYKGEKGMIKKNE